MIIQALANAREQIQANINHIASQELLVIEAKRLYSLTEFVSCQGQQRQQVTTQACRRF